MADVESPNLRESAYLQPVDDVLAALGSDGQHGLTEGEARLHANAL